MAKKNKNDPRLIDTNKGLIEKPGTLAWLTQSAIKVAGLEEYQKVKKNAGGDREFQQWNKIVLLSFFVWGAGFLYVEKAMLAAISFFFLMLLTGLFVSVAGNFHWIPIELPPVPSMMIFGAMIVLLWSFSVVAPLYFLTSKKRRKKYHSMIFSLLVFLVSSVIFWRIKALLDQNIIHGWQFEDESVLLLASWIVSGIWTVGEFISIFVQPLYIRLNASYERSGFRDVFLGFWLGVMLTISGFIMVAGPLSDAAESRLSLVSGVLKQYRFEKIPRQLDFFLSQIKNC